MTERALARLRDLASALVFGPKSIPPLAALILLAASPVRALEPSQVLLVYNRFDADSMAVRDAYRQSRPGVREFDLGVAAMPGNHTISHDQFRQWLRFPIRRHLSSEPGLAEKIICIVLAKGIPHRIDDASNAGCGEAADAMRAEWLEKGDFTAASVDSELTLLWQDLDRGEAGGAFDSKLDGFIANPYYASTEPIVSFSRANLRQPKRFVDVVEVGGAPKAFRAGWEAASAGLAPQRLTAGDFYLVTRLDGPNVPAVVAAINRARKIELDPAASLVILDANEKGDLDKGDYEKANLALRGAGWPVFFERTSHFVRCDEAKLPVIAYASYGQNDQEAETPEDTDYIWCFKFAPGALFNTLESFNGRDFGGAGNRAVRRQTQLSAFIGAGGTLGVGNVWEPFSFAAADNEYLLGNFLARRMTFAEAAYSSLMVLSWQQIVVGDPLAQVTIGRDPARAD